MFAVHKRNAEGETTLTYYGEVVARGETWICVRAPFTFADRDLGYIFLRQGDSFTEWFYTDRWYNVFRINDALSGELKGWYCNLTRPAELGMESVASDDLALDVFVTPQGETLLLDEEEYESLNLGVMEREAVMLAVSEIKQRVAGGLAPFDER